MIDYYVGLLQKPIGLFTLIDIFVTLVTLFIVGGSLSILITVLRRKGIR